MLPLLMTLFSANVFAAEPALESGEVVFRSEPVPGHELKRGTVQAIVDVAPEKLWSVISDCSRYVKVFDHIERSEQLERTADGAICEVEIDLPAPFSNIVGVTHAKHEVTPGVEWRRTWKLVRGDYEINDGQWTLKPLDGGTRTLVTYSVFAVPKNSIPVWMQKKAQKSSMLGMLKRLKQAVSRG